MGDSIYEQHNLIHLNQQPKISVITVVFNGAKYIEQTILSVINQTYLNIEYIIIDGGSTDGTIEIIKKYISKIDYWHSKPDDGIYDAMNKGLAVATGSWVNFMNAGDIFYSNDTIERVFINHNRGAVVIYGSVEILYPDFVRVEAPGSPNKLWQGMQFSHQATFIKLSFHCKNPFISANKITADLAFFYQAYKSGAIFHRSEEVIASVITGGLSESNRILTILSSMDAICEKRIRPLIRLYFYWRVVNSILRSITKACLPRALIKTIISLKHK